VDDYQREGQRIAQYDRTGVVVHDEPGWQWARLEAPYVVSRSGKCHLAIGLTFSPALRILRSGSSLEHDHLGCCFLRGREQRWRGRERTDATVRRAARRLRAISANKSVT
jgi:hypothetical protein